MKRSRDENWPSDGGHKDCFGFISSEISLLIGERLVADEGFARVSDETNLSYL